jgi:hypothetical protein
MFRGGVREAAPDAQGPTNMRGMTSSMTPKMGIAAEEKKDEADRPVMEPGAEGPGVRDWFGALPKATKSNRGAAIDTRAAQRFARGAAHDITRQPRWHGYDVVADEAVRGRCVIASRRAKAWGAELVRQSSD